MVGEQIVEDIYPASQPSVITPTISEQGLRLWNMNSADGGSDSRTLEILEDELEGCFTSGLIHTVLESDGGVLRAEGVDITLSEVARIIGAEQVNPVTWVLGKCAVMMGSAEDFALLLKSEREDLALLSWLGLVFPMAIDPSTDRPLTFTEKAAEITLEKLRLDTMVTLLSLVNNISEHSRASRAIVTFAADTVNGITSVHVTAVDNGIGIPQSVFEKKEVPHSVINRTKWLHTRKRYIEKDYKSFDGDVLELALGSLFRTDTVGSLADDRVGVYFDGGGLSGLANTEAERVAQILLASTSIDAHGGKAVGAAKSNRGSARQLVDLQLPVVRGTLVESYLAQK